MTLELSERLSRFNAKVERLRKGPMGQVLASGLVGLSIRVDAEAVSVGQFGPSQDAIDAFVLTYRLFNQNNDSISLQNVSAAYAKVPSAAPFAERFERVREQANAFLDKPSIVKFRGERLPYRSIVDTFIYGELAHQNEEKRRRFLEWSSVPQAFLAIQNEFLYALETMLRALEAVARINHEHVQSVAGGTPQ